MNVIIRALIQIQLEALLREIPDAHRSAVVDRAAVRLNRARNQIQKRALARAVAADHAHAVVPKHGIRKIAHHAFAPERFAHMPELHSLAPQPRRGRRNRHARIRFRRFHRLQRLVARDALGGFCGARPAAALNPFRFLFQKRLPLALRGLCHLEPLRLHFQVFGIVRLIKIQFPKRQLADPVHHVFQKIAVVRDHRDRAGKFLQPRLQPRDHLRVQMVRRLVQNQHVRRMRKHRRERHALSLTAGQHADLLIKIRNSQPVQNRLRLVFVQRARLRRIPGEHLLQHRILRIHLRRLRQIRRANIRVQPHRALVRLRHTREDLEQRALAGSVHADQAELLARAQMHGHAIQQLLHAVILFDVFRRKIHSVSSENKLASLYALSVPPGKPRRVKNRWTRRQAPPPGAMEGSIG